MKTIIYLSTILLFSFFTLLVALNLKTSDTKESDYKEATNLKEYISYRKLLRADDNGEIPMNALLKAKEHIENMPSNSSRDAGLWEWEWLGPGNIGGRIRTILNDPDNSSIVWIGSVSGGIWKSTDNGAHWSHNNDFLPSLAISSMVFDSQNKNIMYAGTGESYAGNGLPGAGIFKSTDGGTTWTQLPSTNNNTFRHVNRLYAHPDSGNIIFAVTNADSLYKTTDGGATWTPLAGFQSRTLDIKLDPNNTNEIYVGCLHGLSISYDYGASWEWQTTGATGKLPDAGRCEIGISSSSPNCIYIGMDRNGGEIWQSTNNGTTWSLKNTGEEYMSNQGDYNNTIWVDPSNSDHLLVGGINIYRSKNGGSTLTKISNEYNYHNGGAANSAHADQHCIVPVSDYNSSSNPVVLFGNDGGIQVNTDPWSVIAPIKWSNLANSTLGITQFYSGAATTSGSMIVGGSQDNDKLRYHASGSWSGPGNWYQATTGDGGFSAINYNTPSIVYGEYIYLHIFKSTDSGDSYSDAYSGITDADANLTAFFIAPFVMDPNDPTILVAGGSKIWKTTNSAGSWSQIRDTIETWINSNGDTRYYRCSAIDIAKDNSLVTWVGYENGNIAVTTDGGSTWNRVDNNSTEMPNRVVTDIAINPNNINEVWVTFGRYEEDRVWFTDDLGLTWQCRSGTPPNDLPVIQVNTIRVHPQNGNYIYVGTDLGVFASQDKGLNWSVTAHYPDNEGPVNTEVAELFWQGDEFLIAATHGRGMYRTETPLVNIYVDKNEPDGGNGSQANPFNNAYIGENERGPGSNMIIESGTYSISTPLWFHKEGMIKANNGSVLFKK